MSELTGVCVIAVLILGALAVGATWARRRAATSLEAEIEKRRRAEREIEAIRRIKNDIIANVSHEIRTPMHGVIGMVNLLLTTELAVARRHKALQVIHASAEGLLALTDDLLDFSRIEAGKLALQSSDFRLRNLLQRIGDLLRPQAADKGLALRLWIDHEIPDEFHGDPARLYQVLLNLTDNAIRFTRQGEVNLNVGLEKASDDQTTDGDSDNHLADRRLRFTVRDTGIGISPKDHASIFAPFAQADTTAAREFGGTGLGLMISKHLVELMGGEIGFTSTREVGSTFWFALPLAPAQQPVAAIETPLSARPHQGAVADAPRILVVDDNAINRLVSETQLEALGCRTAVAASGPRALELIDEQPFDAVLMDCQMPQLDGYETTRRLRRKEEGTGHRSVVIGVTAHALKGAHENALAAGMDDYLIKPLSVEELSAVLERWLSPTSRQQTKHIDAADAIPEPTPEEPGPLTTIRQLEQATGKALLAKTAASFRREGARNLEAIRRALTTGDADALAQSAHALGGSADYLNASELAQLCDKLEDLAREGDLAGCQTFLRALVTAFDEVTNELDRATKEDPS